VENTMKFISTLFILALLVMAGCALVPIISFGIGLAVMAGVFFVWLLPILIMADSDKTTGGEKAAWILAIIFLSWFAWVFYFFLAPLKPRDDRYYYYYD
jgi:ABC-type nickel/cobalt efflux system permease component RcnA